MKKLCNIMGVFLLSVVSLVTVIGPASLSGYAVEELPDSMKNNR